MPEIKKSNKKSQIRRVLIIILVFLAGFLSSDLFNSSDSPDNTPVFDDSKDRLYLVTEVIDGDTIEINGSDRIRLLEIEAPERGECYFSESKEALSNLIQGEYVRLEKDISGIDFYGRLLRYVFLPQQDTMDDTFVNDYMLEQGFADIYESSQDKRYRGILMHGRNEAVTMGKGMWSECEEELKETTERFETNNFPPDLTCVIKGNVSKSGYGKVYFLPGCADYQRVKIDFTKGDMYFCTEEEAEAAGFKKSESCK